MWLVALGAATAMALAACGGGPTVTGNDNEDKKSVKVGLAFDIGGRGDKSFNDAAYAGLEQAQQDLDVEINALSAKANEPPADKEERLRLLAKGGYNPVIAVGFAYADALTKVADEFKDTKFAIVDGVVEKDNVASLIFAEEQGSFLVGAAAALKSKTGVIGFVGGCLVPLIQKFEAGYVAGAKAVNPSIRVQIKYISDPPKCPGFQDPASGKTTATGMYDGNADIVYQAAGASGDGVFQAAKAKNALAIGVDSDQYNTVDAALRDVIITSMVKRVDVAVFDFIDSVGKDTFKGGIKTFDLKSDGVAYSTSGGKIDDIKSKLDDYKQQIIDGKITVPVKPAGS